MSLRLYDGLDGMRRVMTHPPFAEGFHRRVFALWDQRSFRSVDHLLESLSPGPNLSGEAGRFLTRMYMIPHGAPQWKSLSEYWIIGYLDKYYAYQFTLSEELFTSFGNDCVTDSISDLSQIYHLI